MNIFYEDILPASSTDNLKQLSLIWDSFSSGLKQLVSFQYTIQNAIQELSNRQLTLKNDVDMIGRQVFAVDDSVKSYLERNPVQVLTRDGLTIDSALDGLAERIATLTTRFVHQDETTQKLNSAVETCVPLDDFRDFQQEVSRSLDTANRTGEVLLTVQKMVKDQQLSEDDRMATMKQMFREQMGLYRAELEEKVSLAELDNYAKRSDLTELVNLLKAKSVGKQRNIGGILSDVLENPDLPMEERIKRASELLAADREGLISGELRSDDGFGTAEGVYNEPEEVFGVLVRDIGVMGNSSEAGEIHMVDIKRGGIRNTVWTNFNGPDQCASETAEKGPEKRTRREKPRAPTSTVDEDRIAESVLEQCQPIIERQLDSVLQALGVRVERKDVVMLVNELRVLEEVQKDTKSLKLKLATKVDNSEFHDALRHFVLREELFPKAAGAQGKADASSRKGAYDIPPRPATSMPRKPPANLRPLPLVPARSPFMMGVNDKFLRGKDNKLYLRETGSVGDPAFREPSVTGQPRSYYERSKTSMELEGVEAVFDFQPFIPAHHTHPSPKGQPDGPKEEHT
jgi:hypothetical protein